MGQRVTAAEAVSHVKDWNRVFVHGASATPHVLLGALVARADELRGVELIHLHTSGDLKYTDPKYAKSFRGTSLFIGENIRKATNEGRADYLPVFLSEVPQLFRRGIVPLDVALLHVSPPDRHGWCSLGTSIDAARAAMQTAKIVIAQVNPNMPRTLGDALVHVKQIHYLVDCNEPLPEVKHGDMTQIEQEIGRHVASLVEDGATLQMGIGAIPDAVLRSLTGHKKLGVHTEMFSDGLIPLVEAGVVTGELKRTHPGKIVAGFITGTRKVYDFIDDNPQVLMLDISYVNDTATIRRNPKVTAINSAIEVDFTGQVCADSIGERLYSGVGGQMDFMRGASLSEGGKPIIALPATTSKGESRIVAQLKPGAGVVTTRAHVHYVVTEFGVAHLYGRTLRERAKALTAIAHPDHREGLEREARRRFGAAFESLVG